MKIGNTGGLLAVFPPAHPDVGAVEIHDEGDEVVVVIGRFTHEHFLAYERGLSAEQRAERIADDVVAFLEKLFADRIELFGRGRRGGWRARGSKPRGRISKFLFGRRTYVWSGPLADG